MSTVTTLLGTLRAHLDTTALASGVRMVTLSAVLGEPEITIQLAATAPDALADALLAWADTSRTGRADLWRVPDGARLLVTLYTTLPDHTPIQVYGTLPHRCDGPGADLTPGTSTPISLDQLRTWVPDEEAGTR